jgi:hypothetical protein
LTTESEKLPQLHGDLLASHTELQLELGLFTLKLDAIQFIETSVTTHLVTRHIIPEDMTAGDTVRHF